MSQALRGLVGLVAMVACAVAPGAVWAQSAAGGGVRDLHIEVTERNGSSPLSKHNFVVEQAGKQYSVTLSRPSSGVRTHALVMFAGTGGNRRDFEDVERLFARGWWVSMVLPGGIATPYENNAAAMRIALHVGAAPPFDYAEAFKGLAEFAGRRVLILEQSVKDTNVPMLAEARELIPEIYRVDGGFETESMIDGPPGCRDGYQALGEPPVCNVYDSNTGLPVPVNHHGNYYVGTGESGFYEKRLTGNGVMHEVKFDAAVKDALRDADDYYDLDLKVPASSAGAAFTVTFRHVPNGSWLRVSPAAYVRSAVPGASAFREDVQVPVVVKR